MCPGVVLGSVYSAVNKTGRSSAFMERTSYLVRKTDYEHMNKYGDVKK